MHSHPCREIGDLHKQAAATASEQTQAALSAEMQAKQRIQLQLEQFQMQARQEQEALITQVVSMLFLYIQLGWHFLYSVAIFYSIYFLYRVISFSIFI